MQCFFSLFLQVPAVRNHLIILGIFATMATGLLIVVCSEVLFRKTAVVITLLIWAILFSGVLISIALSIVRSSMDYLHLLIYLILVIYTMLPINKKMAAGLGVVTSLTHLILAGLMANVYTAGLIKQVSFGMVL